LEKLTNYFQKKTTFKDYNINVIGKGKKMIPIILKIEDPVLIQYTINFLKLHNVFNIIKSIAHSIVY